MYVGQARVTYLPSPCCFVEQTDRHLLSHTSKIPTNTISGVNNFTWFFLISCKFGIFSLLLDPVLTDQYETISSTDQKMTACITTFTFFNWTTFMQLLYRYQAWRLNSFHYKKKMKIKVCLVVLWIEAHSLFSSSFHSMIVCNWQNIFLYSSL